MKRMVILLILMAPAASVFSQKIDSIFFHLYTDSLKKGQYNYINVDGKFSDGKWLPLTDKEIQFSCNTAKFKGNELVIPPDFKDEKVTVKAVLRSNPAISLEKTIWIKKIPDPDTLPSVNEILNGKGDKKNKNKGKN